MARFILYCYDWRKIPVLGGGYDGLRMYLSIDDIQHRIQYSGGAHCLTN
jgi:hypothetical protein